MATVTERFGANKMTHQNASVFFGTYVSGMYNKFFNSESEAVAHCNDEANSQEFNGEIFMPRYTTFEIGEVFYVQGKEGVYLTNDQAQYLDAVGAKWQMPFVQWQ